jgi:hypothetical protein
LESPGPQSPWEPTRHHREGSGIHDPAASLALTASILTKPRRGLMTRRLPDDKAIARELGISPNAAKVARWRYAARRDKPHVARIAA